MRLRDETRTTGRRVDKTSPSGGTALVLRKSQSPPTPDFSLYSILSPPSAETQAVNFCFASTKACNVSIEAGSRYLELLPTMYARAGKSSALRPAAEALSLSLMWKAKRRSDMASAAHAHHCQALQALAGAIGDPVEAYSDETIMTIMLLQMYEALVGSDSGRAIRNHVQGAVLIAMQRGQSSFQSEQSMRIFRAVRAILIQHNTYASISVSELTGNFDWFGDEEAYLVNPYNRFTRLSRISAQVNELRASSKKLFDTGSRRNVPPEEVDALSREALNLLKILQAWYDELPSTYRYQTVVSFDKEQHDPNKVRPWRGITHVYEGLWEGNQVCTWASQRIYIAGVLLRCRCWTKYGTSTGPLDFLTRVEGYEIIQDAVDRICAALPWFFGDLTANQSSQGVDDVAGRSVVFITGPLWVAYVTEGISEQQREFMRGCLVALGERFGLDTARLIVKTPPSLIFQWTPFP
ncbi:hypothetical protein FH972_022919 [Carpinus fangiana]|uniref:Uncharacterized protein n=1 Tax=Carpinus fangiana TaxID=176857 RepID=A0A5N6KTY2_9ROSI|nr:hypothetical protein FH972_022919 [Carpinus fangiana]